MLECNVIETDNAFADTLGQFANVIPKQIIITGSPMRKTAITGLAACLLFSLSLLPVTSYGTVADRLNSAAAPLQLDNGNLAHPVLLLDISFAGERLVAVGEQGIILYSDDRGQRWQQAEVPVTVLLTALYFVDPQYGWAVGHDGVVLHSHDGGVSWQRQLEGSAINQQRVTALQQAITGARDEEMAEELEYALEEAQYAAEEGASVPLLDIWFRDRSFGYAVGAYGMLLQTRDGGQSWQSQDHLLPNPDRFHLNALHASRDGALYLAGEAGILFRQQPGEPWQPLESGYDGSLFALQSAPDNSLYLMGLRGHLFHSVSGYDWQPVPLAAKGSINGMLFDRQGNPILLGLGGLLLRRQGSDFQSMSGAGRRSFSAAVRLDNELLLVGDGGFSRITLAQPEQGGVQ